MNIAASHTAVLIVGAGPSGLMMAAQLIRNGVLPIIIDSKQGPSVHSKALAVQARSLEIYRQMGIVDAAVRDGKQAAGVQMNIDTKPVASLPLNEVGAGYTLFPYVLLYPQNKNERLLLDYLTANCCPVYWDTTITAIYQQEKQVRATLMNSGCEITLSCNYIVGADGAHSTVRKLLDIPFKGDTYQHSFYLADVTLQTEIDNQVHLYLADKGFAAFFPMPEERRVRIVGKLPDVVNSTEPALAGVLPYLNQIMGTAPAVEQCHWFTNYKLHHRMAAVFSQQRCFLIGDAAHIHSPVGGQGMNTGLQDAYNLAWKLAGVINTQFKPAILDSYAAERMPVATQLLKTTDKAFNLILSKNVIVSSLRKWLMPAVIRRLWKNDTAREVFFKKVSQIDISYRQSKLNLHLSNGKSIMAGDRLPYLKIYDEKKQTETDLHQWCSKPGFTLITLGKISEEELLRLARWIQQDYAHLLNFFYLPPSQKNRYVFNAFQTSADQRKTIIVRPDMYIGLISDGTDTGIISNYLRNVVGVI
jgi:2-polyprenyl-6-methoxyphenol hydroxylase-like FAD-dependent oxidoreductase